MHQTFSTIGVLAITMWTKDMLKTRLTLSILCIQISHDPYDVMAWYFLCKILNLLVKGVFLSINVVIE